MLGFSYIKVDPNFYVIHYANGRIRREGRGLAFFYFQPSAAIVVVPVGSVDVPFIFNELTADYQEVTLQGQITYRVSDPIKLSQSLNYTVVRRGRAYATDDPQKLAQRIVSFAQVVARPEVQKLPLKAALHATREISAGTMEAIRAADAFQSLGIEVLALSLLSIRPTPEMAKAIEAEAREELQKKADQAVSARRNAAVEQERQIKENELTTEQIVCERQQQLQKSRLEAEISQEQRRESLVALQAANSQKEADAGAYVLRASLEPLAKLDPHLLEVLASSRADPRVVVALALKDLAADASKIGQLNITPDLLSSLLKEEAAGRGPAPK